MEKTKFMETIETCYPLNKQKNRYLIMFNDKTFGFYKYDRKNEILTKEVN